MDPRPRELALLVDGHNLLFASYFGMPDRIRATDGRPVHGTYGFVASLLAMIRRFSPAVIVVCFDSEERTFRHEVLPGYKANRIALSPDRNPFSQYGDIRRALDLMRIPWVEGAGFEADDLIGSISAAVSKTLRIVISSRDQDVLQLVDESVMVYVRGQGREQEYGVAEVVARYGVTPVQFVDYRALVGDSSDNIPGVNGIGPKTAQRLLCELGSLEGIYEARDRLPRRIARKLDAAREGLEVSRALLRIRRDLPVEPRLIQRWEGSGGPQTQGSARDLMRELGLWA